MKRSETSPYPVAALTHPGMSGKNNEDRFGVSAFILDDRAQSPVLLAVLADGIGGHRAGEVAAEIVIETLSRVVAESDGDKPQEILHAAILEASQAVLEAAQGQADRQGMGSTCACIWLIKNRLYTVTVGDSRIYLMHNGHIRQLSTDHTWVQEALEYGLLQPDELKSHPNAHVIRRYLGSVKPVVPDFRLRLEDGEKDDSALQNQGLDLFAGDRLIMCSDGLTDLVDAGEIAGVFAELSPADALQELVDLANERGGHDNITVVTLEIPQAAIPRKRRGRVVMRIMLILVAMAALTGLLWFGLRKLGTQPLPTQPTPTITIHQDLLRTPPAGIATSAPGQVVPSASSTLAPVPSTRTLPVNPGGPTYTPWPTNTQKP